MPNVKRFFKRNSHNNLFKGLAGFGRALNRFYENRNHDLYSNGELTVLKKISKFNPSVIIDGGANIGKYSLLINHLSPSSKIYSFEPVKSTFEKLKKNVASSKNIVPVEKGFYKENCISKINMFTYDEHSSIYNIQGSPYELHGQQTIELVRGDDFIKNSEISEVDFLKIDVEGAEYDALLGFEQTIKEGKIKAIQFEYGYINITTKKLLVDYYDFFEKEGYVLGKIFPKIVEFRKYEFKYEDFLGPNYIAVKKSEVELINALKRK
jgi:FkbM family methyltransferase